MNNQSLVRVRADNLQTTVDFVVQLIETALMQNKHVLWLVSGGSCIEVAVRVRKCITGIVSDTQLDVMLVDERYGEVGHKDSNSTQLKQSGFILDDIAYTEILDGTSAEETTERFGRNIEELAARADFVIGLFGMGADGHTAGLLPGNPLMQSVEMTGMFEGPDYLRITTTPKLLAQIDHAVLYAVGENKWPALLRINQPGSADELPVRILKHCETLTIFSDTPDDI